MYMFEGFVTEVNYEDGYGYLQSVNHEELPLIKFCIEVDADLNIGQIEEHEVYSFHVLIWNGTPYAIIQYQSVFNNKKSNSLAREELDYYD